MILYNDETCKDAAITANSVNPNYPATNLVDSRLTRLYRTVASTTAEVVFDCGSAVSVTSAVIASHNITASATVIKIQGNATDSWGSPSVSETITYDAGVMHKRFTGGSYRYWRIQIIDATNTDGYIEIGRAWIGTYYTTPGIAPTVTSSLLTATVKTRSTGGQSYGDKRHTYYKFITNFPAVTYTQKASLETMFISLDHSTPFFIYFDSEGIDLDIYYVTIDQDELRFTLLINSDYYACGINYIEEK